MNWKTPEGRVFILMMLSLLLTALALVLILAMLGMPVYGINWVTP